MKDLVEVDRNSTTFTFKFHFRPMGIGRLRLMLMIEHACKMMYQMGFTKNDVEEIKSMFSDTNVYLLLITILVAGVHVRFIIFSW